ncbi:hypothetical protein GUITHDRAFT_122027 [Guillardia theta CCMP2712]|uniref:Uncharacterized protein n=1 Tax=Guillardia theta (strain CCMP2712) TaxID=905079 RepID=L1I6B5_GUITC|nr:hypothetical protein GUITHDRAFT_122027 [Guillardia theta CCMP2712]EKX31783.1 hypothetical protein GUITHDRAFT_122027 [Guillardia theta CCMP2712]|eukprot:XP_005818763.1 hypothetical protein GUITHDRAFT_122027 [Guillardia theta CCMP2712]
MKARVPIHRLLSASFQGSFLMRLNPMFAWVVCLLVVLQPAIAHVLFVGDGTDTSSWCRYQSCAAKKEYSIVVGQALDLNVSATNNLTAASNTSMVVLNVAGLPNGCQISEVTYLASYVMDYSLNATLVQWYTMRRVQFTPRAGQEGLSYQGRVN